MERTPGHNRMLPNDILQELFQDFFPVIDSFFPPLLSLHALAKRNT